MATVRNISNEQRSVPLLRRDIDPDEVVDVPDEYLEDYAWPADTWEVHASTDDPRTVSQLRVELKDRGLPTSGTKVELIERLAQEPAQPADENGE